MEEQRISLANVLLKDPDLDIDAEVDVFRRQLNEALQEINPNAAAQVTSREDWVSVTLGGENVSAQEQHTLIEVMYRIKAEWINRLIIETG